MEVKPDIRSKPKVDATYQRQILPTPSRRRRRVEAGLVQHSFPGF